MNYPVSEHKIVSVAEIEEMRAENKRLKALLTTAEISPDADPQEIRDGKIEREQAWFEKELEVARLLDRINLLEKEAAANLGFTNRRRRRC